MPVEDAEIARIAQKQLEKLGLKIKLGAKVSSLKKAANSVTATIEQGATKSELTVDRVISAVGVVGNIENLGLETLGVKTEKGCVVIDGFGRTNVAGIYAIGDVAGPPMLAHKAEHEGVICIEKIKGLDAHPMKKEQIPGCTYCHPQVASVGLTEAKAKAAGFELKVGRFPFIGNGKAIALGEPEGLIKTVFDAKTGELLGAHMGGTEVTELIQGYVVGRTLETTEAELMETVFPHPTLSEMMHEAVLDAYGRAQPCVGVRAPDLAVDVLVSSLAEALERVRLFERRQVLALNHRVDEMRGAHHHGVHFAYVGASFRQQLDRSDHAAGNIGRGRRLHRMLNDSIVDQDCVRICTAYVNSNTLHFQNTDLNGIW